MKQVIGAEVILANLESKDDKVQDCDWYKLSNQVKWYTVPSICTVWAYISDWSQCWSKSVNALAHYTVGPFCSLSHTYNHWALMSIILCCLVLNVALFCNVVSHSGLEIWTQSKLKHLRIILVCQAVTKLQQHYLAIEASYSINLLILSTLARATH